MIPESIRRLAAEIVPEEELAGLLGAGRPLRVKLGVDPTTAELHLGHTVVLGMLRAFQDLGHTAVFIVGDFTARIGDPSGRSGERPPLCEGEIEENAKTFLEQAGKILRPDRLEVRRNSEWLSAWFIRTGELLSLLSRVRVPQLLTREDFRARLDGGGTLSVLEMLYPVLQALDSVEVKADVELGGTDQKFNILLGRDLQKEFGQRPQVAVLSPILVGLDGTRKMSKTFGNAIALEDPPEQMYGKIMSLPDALVPDYLRLLLPSPPPISDPYASKKHLARAVVARFHTEEAARRAAEEFERVFSRREAPSSCPEFRLSPGQRISEILIAAGLVRSRKEAQRLLREGAVEQDGRRLAKDDPAAPGLLRVGKHRFLRLLSS